MHPSLNIAKRRRSRRPILNHRCEFANTCPAEQGMGSADSVPFLTCSRWRWLSCKRDVYSRPLCRFPVRLGAAGAFPALTEALFAPKPSNHSPFCTTILMRFCELMAPAILVAGAHSVRSYRRRHPDAEHSLDQCRARHRQTARRALTHSHRHRTGSACEARAPDPLLRLFPPKGPQTQGLCPVLARKPSRLTATNVPHTHRRLREQLLASTASVLKPPTPSFFTQGNIPCSSWMPTRAAFWSVTGSPMGSETYEGDTRAV